MWPPTSRRNGVSACRTAMDPRVGLRVGVVDHPEERRGHVSGRTRYVVAGAVEAPLHEAGEAVGGLELLRGSRRRRGSHRRRAPRPSRRHRRAGFHRTRRAPRGSCGGHGRGGGRGGSSCDARRSAPAEPPDMHALSAGTQGQQHLVEHRRREPTGVRVVRAHVVAPTNRMPCPSDVVSRTSAAWPNRGLGRGTSQPSPRAAASAASQPIAPRQRMARSRGADSSRSRSSHDSRSPAPWGWACSRAVRTAPRRRSGCR